MNKNIVLLSKSKKYNNYCVAGKDIETGEWIRLISRNKDIHNAIDPKHLVYSNGSEANILDIINVNIEEVSRINRYQPENYYLNAGAYLGYKGRLLQRNLYSYMDDSDQIFFNEKNCVPNEDLNNISNINSLLILEIDYLKVRVKPRSNRRLYANIKYKGRWYNYLTITDMEFTEKYYDEIANCRDGKCFYNKNVVISLGEYYNGSHYKLIATVID